MIRTSISTRSPSWRSRFTRPVFIWAMCALLTEIAVQKLGGRNPPPWLTLAPVIPAILFVWALYRGVKRMDELQRRICLESAFVAFLLTLVLAFVIAGFETAGLYHGRTESLGAPMLFLWACGYVVYTWRYR